MATVSKLQIVLEAQTTAFDRGLKTASDSLLQFERKTKNIHNKMERFQKRHKAAFDGIKTAGAVAGVALAGVGAAIGSTVSEAMKFEDAMAEVKKVVDFDSPQGIKEFRNDLEDLSSQLPIAFEGLADIAAAAGQAGIAKEEIIGFTEAAAKMGTAFDITADQAGQAMAEMRTAFGMSQVEVETLSDKINYLGNTTPNTAAKILEVVQLVGPLGEIAGVSADQIAAMGASITSLAPDRVATGLKNMMLSLTAGGSATKAQRAAFMELGMTAEEVASGMQRDSKAMISTVLDAIRSVNPDEQAAIINTLFGKEALPVVSQLITGGELLQTNLEAVGDATKYAGSMNAEYEARAATLSNSMQILRNKIQIAKVAIGEAFMPVIAELVEKIGPVTDKIAGWAKANPELVKTMAVVAGGALALVAGLGTLAVAFTAVSSGLGAVAGIAGLVATAIGAISLPVVAVTAVIGGLVAAGVYLYRNWDEIKAKAGEVWEGIKTVFTSIPETVSTALEGMRAAIGEKFAALGEFFAGVWDGIKLKATEVFNSLPEPVQGSINRIIEVFGLLGTAWDTAAAGARIAFEAIKSAASSMAQWVAEKWESLKATASAVWGAIVAVTAPAWDAIKSTVSAGVDIVVSVFTTAFDGLKAIASGAWEGVKSVVRTGWEAVKALFTAGLSAVATVFNTGFDLVKNAVKTAMDVVKALVRGDMQGVADAFRNGMSNAKNIVSNGLKQIFDVIKNLGKQMFSLGKDFIQGFINGIKSLGSGVVSAASSVAKNALSAVRRTQDSHSPAKKTRKLAHDFVDGYIIGIKDKTSEAYKAARQLVKTTLDGLADLRKQIALFGKDSAVDAFDYDVAQGKYKGIADSLIQEYRAELVKFEQLKKEADLEAQRKQEQESARQKLSNSIKQRAEQFKSDQKSAEDAFNGLDVNGPQTELERLRESYRKKMEIVDEFERMHTDKKAQAEQARLRIEQQYNDSLKQLELAKYQSTLNATTALFGSLLGESSKGYNILFNMQKGYDFVMAESASLAAIAKAWNSAPFPANLAAVATTTLETGVIPAAIQAINPKGFKTGGYTGNYPKDTLVGPVHGQEFVAHADATRRYRSELEAMNNGTYERKTGNTSINVNVTVTGSGQGSVESNHKLGRQIGHGIEGAILRILEREKRPGGLLYA